MPHLPRREFLTTTAATLAFAALAPPLVFGGSRRAEASGADLSKPLFEAWQGRDFTLAQEPGGPPLHLTAVTDGPTSSEVEQFQASFRAARGTGLPEGMHTLHAPDGRSLELFLKPTGQDASGDYLTAEFALIRPMVANSC